jgi:hypothetical protein
MEEVVEGLELQLVEGLTAQVALAEVEMVVKEMELTD